ncbi:MAG TPA: hypothetical protein VK485_00410 [Sphingomicrobium sp.]|nr:hypothetical protein [Sphingomicrobium sp.]
MFTDLRINACLSMLATAALCASVASHAYPRETTVANASRAAAQLRFPKTLTADGRQYDRLTGVALEQAIRGKSFCPSPVCSGIDGEVAVFKEDGQYLVFGDRWDDGGRYTIVNDAVIVTLGQTVRTFAFYLSAGGVVRQAWENSAGKIESMRVFK